MGSINVLVLDDEWSNIAPLLSHDGITFRGIDSFSIDRVLGAIKPIEPIVLLLDILHAGHEKPGREEAGIRLFRDLGDDPTWQKLNGSVQIVFFSSDATAKREWKIAKERRSDVAGYVSKQKLLEGDPGAISILRNAFQKAQRYAQFLIINDKEWVHEVRRRYGLLCSPNTRAMELVWEKILAAGFSDFPVLIQGETGTGKELVARAIYEVTKKVALEEAAKPHGKRRKVIGSARWVPYNIGSAPTEGNLQYTELFGAYPESASGITKYRRGIFEKAGGGTIFLDEIGDAASNIQVSLLRVLQENKILPLGGFDEDDGEKDVVYRLVAASHVDLPKKVKEGIFRADLFYRLRIIEIGLPPLRERKDDIPVLVYNFLQELNEKYKRSIQIPDQRAEAIFDRLKVYDWPGNVRQLQSAIHASYAFSFGRELVLSDDIEKMLEGETPAPPLPIEALLESLETSPRSLPKLGKAYGEPAAEAVARAWVKRAGRHPNEEESQCYFASTRQAVRKWMGDHSIPSPRGRKVSKNRPNQVDDDR